MSLNRASRAGENIPLVQASASCAGKNIPPALASASPAGRVDGFGAKTIGTFGSFALLVNNISGPGMLQFPAAFQNAGWVPSLVVLALVTVLSTLAGTLLCDAMARIPGNHRLERRVEFSSVLAHFVGPRAFAASQAAYVFLSRRDTLLLSAARRRQRAVTPATSHQPRRKQKSARAH